MPPVAKARVARGLAWAWFTFVACAALGFGIIDAVRPSSLVASDVITYLAPIGVAASLAILLALRTRPFEEHRFWVQMAVALGLVGAAESYWTWYTSRIDPAGPPTLSPLLILYLASGLAFVSVAVTMGRAVRQPMTERARSLLDVLAGALLVFPIIYLVWTLPLFSKTSGGWHAAAVAASYPIFGVLLVGATLSVLIGWRARHWRGWERLLSGTLIALALVLSTWPLWYADQIRPGGVGLTRFASLLGVVIALLSVTMVYRLTDPDGAAPLEPLPSARPEGPLLSRVYPVVLVLALPTLGVLAAELGARGRGLPVSLAVIALALVLAIRSVVVSVEQAENLQRSYTDPATGMLNRTWLDTTLRRLLASAQRTGTPISLTAYNVADEDRFNAVIGHSAGEEALAKVGAILAQETPSPGEVFALSACEFVVIQPGVHAAEAAKVARRTWLRLLREALVEGRPLDIAAGVSESPAHAAGAADLLEAAEKALTTARGAETEPVVVFGEQTQAPDQASVQLRTRMRTVHSTIRMLAGAVDERDVHTRDHSQNVSELATALARVMELDEDEIHVIGLAAAVHDVGKVGVHDDILLKGELLSHEERAEMQSHSVLGERILAPTKVDNVLPLVRSHHERWDGTGYPDGLERETIPLGARILGVCDAYEAMTAGRSYQPAIESEAALLEIEKCAGTQFDPRVAATFVRMMATLEVVRGAAPAGLGRAGLDAVG